MARDHEKISKMRRDYRQGAFSPDIAADNPMEQFGQWFREAVAAEELEPNAMILATVSEASLPDARVLLLKGYDEHGFYFYTNYQSQKAKELAHNPHAAIVFNWLTLERQVRIRGEVRKAENSYSDRYYHIRPKGSQLGAWVSPQSQIIPHREFLNHRLEELKEIFKEQETLPRPPFWGGYRLRPTTIEFWQGRSSRLHDRVLYQEENGIWKKVRLAP